MGMFDTVYLDCPKCGYETGEQSKAGDCELIDYTIYEAPVEILADIIKYNPYGIECRNCGHLMKLHLQHMVSLR